MRAIAFGLAAVAVGVGIFWGGGFDPVPQWTFAAVAGTAGLAALAAGRRWSAPVLVLLALAALQALSAAWTIGSPAGSLRAGALTAGYAAAAIAAAGTPPRRITAILVAAAGVTGLMGLTSAALFSTAFAERIEGGWRPEGPFGYPPALALVQVFALPALLTAMTRARPAVAALAAGGAATAAGVLVLAANRLTLACAVLVLGLAFAVLARRAAAAAVGLVLVAGIAFHELLGGWTSRHAHAGAGGAVAALGLVVGLALVWLAVRPRLTEARASRKPALKPALAAGAALVAVALVAGLFSGGALSARRFPSHAGFTHGRTWMWSAAYHTALERPLSGTGAGTFYRATLARQPGHGRVTVFAHDLPLELGVETGAGGFLLGLVLYAAAGVALWRARRTPAAWLLGPAVGAFLLANLVDWSWHLAGIGSLFALALAGVTPARALRP